MTASANSVSIVVPTRNEVENVASLVEQIVAAGVPFHEIIFVDGQSTDGTHDRVGELSQKHSIRLLEQDKLEPGLAAAILAGARAAEAENLVVMDADLSHPPERINDLLAPLLKNEADMVIGSRYVPGGATSGWPLWRKILSRTGGLVAQPITGVHDSMCGFFAMKRSRLLEINPPTVGFKIVFETIARARRSESPLRVLEVPIVFRDRTRGQSKMSFGIALKFFVRWLAAFFRACSKRSPLKSMDMKTLIAAVISGILLFALSHTASAKDQEFKFEKADATSVELMCECKDWKGQQMTKGSDGVWTITLSLEPGTYGYKFLVNGTDWVFDPKNDKKKTVNGTENSSIEIAAEDKK